MKSPTNNTVAIAAMTIGAGLDIYVFAASRNDPGLRMAALVAATSAGAALLAIASTLLIGKDVTKPDPADLPPGSVSTQNNTLQVPPITPAVADPLAVHIPQE